MAKKREGEVLYFVATETYVSDDLTKLEFDEEVDGSNFKVFTVEQMEENLRDGCFEGEEAVYKVEVISRNAISGGKQSLKSI